MTLAEFRRAYLTATFTPACREDLIALMPSPTVVTDLTGGHLALMVRLELSFRQQEVVLALSKMIHDLQEARDVPTLL